MSRGPAGALATTVLASATLLWGCGDGPTVPRTPVATPTPAPLATPTPAPLPTPTPEPTATPTTNRPPTVTVTSSGGCHPLLLRPCTVSFNASASDPDGDTLRFGWDGCAQGNGPLALCTITTPGVYTAAVLVDDGQGGLARASATAEGRNQAPVIRFGARPPNPAPSNTVYTLVGGQPYDPDDDDDPNRLCTRVTLIFSGPCRAGVALCGGVADAFDVDVTTLQGPGTCVVEARVSDSWGAVGSDRLVFTVLP